MFTILPMKKFEFSVYYLQELKNRIAYATFGVTLFFFTTYTYKQGLIFLFLPKGLSHFVTTGVTEIFFTYLQLCFNLTITFAIIILLTQLFFFFTPGLYRYESNIYFKILIITIFFNTVLYTSVAPIIIQIFWRLFYTDSTNFMPINLTLEPKLINYIQQLQQFNTLINFSFPILIILNIIQNNTSTKIWVKYRGLIYILSFTFAAFITPPDIISQILVGIPLILIYEMQIIYKILKNKYKKYLLIRKPIESYKYTHGKDKKCES